MTTFAIIRFVHLISVITFLFIYLFKTYKLLFQTVEQQASFKAKTKVLEMIVSALFLLTGGYMLTQIPEIKPMMYIKIALVLASIPIAIIAYKRSNKLLAILSLVLIIASYGLAEMSKKPRIDKSTAESMDGATLFSANCSRCHGDDGKLGLTGASDLSVSTLDEAGVMSVILNGRGTMTPYKGVLSDEQAKVIATYILGLRK